MRDLAIYGAGGFGRETALMVEQINAKEQHWNIVGFFDDKIKAGDKVDGYPVLGGLTEASRMDSSIALVVAIADPVIRMNIVVALQNLPVEFPTLIHPQAMTGSMDNSIGRGSIITAGCIFTTGISIGEFCIVNLAVTLGHDVRVGNYSTIMPGCSVSGNVGIGKFSMIGTGVRILQNITLGDKCIVGAGAVVIKSFDASATLVGVPATQIK